MHGERDKIFTLIQLSRLYYDMGELEHSKERAKEAILAAEKHNLPKEQGKAFFILAEISEKIKNIIEAESWYKKSLEIFIKTDDKKITSRIHNQLAVLLLFDKKNHLEAGHHFICSLKIYHQLGKQENFMRVAKGYAMNIKSAPSYLQDQLYTRWLATPFHQLVSLEKLAMEIDDEITLGFLKST